MLNSGSCYVCQATTKAFEFFQFCNFNHTHISQAGGFHLEGFQSGDVTNGWHRSIRHRSVVQVE